MNRKPHLIMPMGGAGSRFYRNGYMIPKPMIVIEGRPFFYWAARSITRFMDVEDVTFVILQSHVDEFQADQKIREYFPDAVVKVIPGILPGPVYTCLEGVRDIADDAAVIFNDCDHLFKCERFYRSFEAGEYCEDGALFTFESTEPQFSYIRFEGGRIIGTVEKVVASDRAICGAYVFKSAAVFRRAASEYIRNCPYNECFMSGVYNILASEGSALREYPLDYHVEFGTPEEYERAQGSEHFAELL